MSETSFESTNIDEWSIEHTKDWLKWCLNNYQLEDPYLYTKIKLKGKTLKVYHQYHEFHKFYSEADAEKLHEDLERRLNPPSLEPLPYTQPRQKIRTKSKHSIALWNIFEKHLDEINIDCGKLFSRVDYQDEKPYPKELLIEALSSIKSSSTENAHSVPIECIISRMASTFSKLYSFSPCETITQHFEFGHVKLRLSIDDAVGFFVQKFYMHSYPALAELMLEHILYLGQQNTLKNDSVFSQIPAIPHTPKIPRSISYPINFTSPYIKPKISHKRKESELSDADSGIGSPRISISSRGKQSLDPINEDAAFEETGADSERSGYRNQDIIFVEGNHIVVDHTMDQINEKNKLIFDFDNNLMIKFEVNSQGEEPKTITNINKLFKIKIENTTAKNIGFSLRTYNLSMPGNLKVLYPVTKGFHVLSSKQSNIEFDGDKWEQEIELQIESAWDYINFELVVCSLSGDGRNNTWNIQSNSIHVKCETEDSIDVETKNELYKLSNTRMGNGKRKKCMQILLESLYHSYNNDDYEHSYWLATQLLLLPDFQRPQLLVLCWLMIGTHIYRERELDFLQQRCLIALINAGTDIKKKCSTMNINTLNNIMQFAGKAESILRGYQEQHKITRSKSFPEAKKKNMKLQLLEVSSPATGNSPVLTPELSNLLAIPSPMTKSRSEPSLNTAIEEPSCEVNTKTTPLIHKLTRKASQIADSLTFEKCEIICPPCETDIDISFRYTIVNSPTSQITIVPGILHLATLELSSELDNGTYRIKFPLPNNISEKQMIRVVYHNGEVGEDITEKIEQNFNIEAHIGNISVPRNGNYVILGVEGYPSRVSNYVADEIMSLRTLYALLWARNTKGYRKEIWCCVSCQEDRLLRPPHNELISICKLQIRTKLNSKIEISLQFNKDIEDEEPEMKYEFYLTDSQGIYNFVQELQLERGKNEGRLTIQSPIEKSGKDVQV